MEQFFYECNMNVICMERNMLIFSCECVNWVLNSFVVLRLFPFLDVYVIFVDVPSIQFTEMRLRENELRQIEFRSRKANAIYKASCGNLNELRSTDKTTQSHFVASYEGAKTTKENC